MKSDLMQNISELQLIERYLERTGANMVTYVSYYHEGALVTVDATTINIGVVDGIPANKCWFFGEVNINATIAGVIVLTNQMLLNLQFMTILPGKTEVGYVAKTMGVGLGMSLLGNGEYEGCSRLYAMGFNRVVTNKMGFGAATFAVRYCFNGYLFTIR